MACDAFREARRIGATRLNSPQQSVAYMTGCVQIPASSNAMAKFRLIGTKAAGNSLHIPLISSGLDFSEFGSIAQNSQHSQTPKLILSHSFWHLYLAAEASR